MFFSYAMILLSVFDLVLRTIPELKNSTTAFNIIEIICMSWFTFEFLLRFIVCPSKLQFIKSVLNIIEFLSIVPFYFYLIFQTVDEVQRLKNVSRILRSFGLFKIVRYSRGIRVLLQTFKKSYKEIGLYLIYLAVGVLTFSSLLYYTENSKKDTKFTSIPSAFWWAIITMTTVGSFIEFK